MDRYNRTLVTIFWYYHWIKNISLSSTLYHITCKKYPYRIDLDKVENLCVVCPPIGSTTTNFEIWLSQNCKYYILDRYGSYIYFFRKEDAVLCRLVWM